MWISVIGSILLAILGEESGEEEDKKRVLGLTGRGQLEFPFGSHGDLMVPVRIWADGAGIFRIIGWEDLKETLAGLNGKTFFSKETLKESLCADEWVEDELTGSSGGSTDAYVYIDDRDHGHRPSVLLLTGADHDDDISDIDVIPLHSRRRGDKSMIRIRAFIQENEWPDDNLPQTIETGLVPDKLVEAWKRVREGEDPKKICEETAKSFDRVERQIGLWVDDYVELRLLFSLMEGLASELNSVASSGIDDEDLFSEFKEVSDEDQIEEAEEELKNFAESPTFERWRDGRIEDIQDQIRQNCTDIERVARGEAAGLGVFLKDIALDRQSEHSRRSVAMTWRVSEEGSSRYDEGIDTLELHSTDEGNYYYSLDEANFRFSPDRPGAFEALYAAGYIETEGERKNKIGEPIWRFPGGLSGTWEINHILDRFTPNGTEPLFVFIKIAADHGLLSPYAQKKYEKLLLLWGDENLEELLEMHGVFKGAG